MVDKWAARGRAARPDVTVIIPTHNRADFLTQAVESCRTACGSATLEIIVVDDGSDDDTPTLAKALGPDVRFIRLRVRRGPSLARNSGMFRARGRWLKFLDSDDLLEAGCLEEEAARGDGADADLVVSGWITSRQTPGGTWSSEGGRREPPLLTTPLEDVLEGRVGLANAALYRRSSLGPVRWDPRLTLLEDWDFYFRASLRARTRIRLEQPGYCYRLHGGERLTRPELIGQYALSHFQLVENLIAELGEQAEQTAIRRRLAQIYYRNLRIAWRVEPKVARHALARIRTLDPDFMPSEFEPSRLIRLLCRMMPLEAVLGLYVQARRALEKMNLADR